MTPTEAKWFGQALARFPESQLTPMVNLGSSSWQYRSQACPEINSLIFDPLEARNVRVIHVDAKAAEGVDIVGDIFSREVQDGLQALRPRSIMCNNLLEHVKDREAFARICQQLLRPGGLLFVSVPHRYPFHPDPIDTMYRPTLADLEGLFTTCHLVSGTCLPFGNYLGQLQSKRWLLWRDLYLVLAGAFKPERWRVLRENYGFLFREFEVTCAILIRTTKPA
jgi:SAM-dependent methyltransferase